MNTVIRAHHGVKYTYYHDKY